MRPLAADRHEFDSTFQPKPPDGNGWALIAITGGVPAQEQWEAGFAAIYHWARRRDGRPVSPFADPVEGE